MFDNWFRTRTPGSPERERFFRPRLECLEGRLAPSSMMMGGDDGHGHGHGDGGGDGGRTPGQMRNDDNDREHEFINDFDDFDEEINEPVNIVMNNLQVNDFIFLAGLPTAQLQQVFGFTLNLAMQTNPTAAVSLVTNEVSLAKDTAMLVTDVLAGMTPPQSLLTDIHNLQSAIQHNPLESTFVGQVTGALAFDLTLRASLPPPAHM
jgi:hypothetical protein